MIKQLFLTLTISALVSAAPIKATCSPELADQIVESVSAQLTKAFANSHILMANQIKNMPFTETVTLSDIEEYNQVIKIAVLNLFNTKKPALAVILSQKFTDDQEALRYLELINDPVMQKLQTLSLEISAAIMPTPAEMTELQDNVNMAAQKIEAKISAAKDLSEAAICATSEACAATCGSTSCDTTTCTITIENN
jgi:hypothetical protein